MAVVEKNFTATPIEEIPVDSEYVRCNFARLQPARLNPNPEGHRLFPGDDTPRTFRDCNLFNCETPPGSTLENCNTWIVETGITPAAQEDDVVIVDGVEVERIVYHDRTTYGKWNGSSYDYITPVTSPEDY